MPSFRDKNGVLMVDDMQVIFNIVSLPPNAFTHTAAAGHVLAIGRIQSAGFLMPRLGI